ncbi:MAG: hypothetical protein H0T62_05855 [Parachlamydiaceae bacterium]|nr:hypothetical protein [Parachlamydiaceae bacterium]
MSHKLKKSRLIVFYCLLLTFCLSSQLLEAATLHAVIVGDTNDREIGNSANIGMVQK